MTTKCHTCPNETDDIYCDRCEEERRERFARLDKEPDVEEESEE